MELRNRWVHFKLGDVFVPDPQEVSMELYGDQILQGTVIDVTESSDADGTFVVVSVIGLRDPVIVRVEKILGVA